MNLLLPLGLLGLIGIPILIIIYILKSKYVEKTVSSTFIWKRSLKYIKKKIPIQFIFSILLILQLLIVIIGSLTLSNPTITPMDTKDTIIIIDASASMMTKNSDGESRFDLALEQARDEVRNASDNHKYTIISAGFEADCNIMRSAESMDIINAIDKMSCSYSQPDIEGALEFANEVQNINNEAKIYFYTDRDYLEQYNVEVVNFSSDSDRNLAITNLTTTYTGGKYIFYATIENFGEEIKDVNVELEVLKDTGLDISGPSTYTFPANSLTRVVFSTRMSDAGENDAFFRISEVRDFVNAKVVLSNFEDGLAEDNERIIWKDEITTTKILVVSQYATVTKSQDGTYEADPKKTTFLISALRNMGYTLNNRTDIKKEIEQVNNGNAIEGYDLYIFDGVMPEVLPEDGAVWFIDPPKDPVGTSIILGEEEGENAPYYLVPAVSDESSVYSIITNKINISRISLKAFRPITYANEESGYTDLYLCDNKTIICAGKENNVRVVVVSFDISDSNFPMYPAFPMILNNMISYSLPRVVEKTTYDVGEIAKYYAPVGSSSMKVLYEDSVIDALDSTDSEIVLDRVGDYSVEITYANGEVKTIHMPTNIPNSESDISLNGDAIVANDITSASQVEKAPVKIWPYLAMLLLFLVVVEWGVYYHDEF